MNLNWKEAKEIYESTPIPKELDSMVKNTIEKRKKVIPMKSNFKKIGILAASLILGMTVAVNTNETFAKSMENIPILGNVAKVLTIRHYEENVGNEKITANFPAIDSDTVVANTANQEIEKIIQQYIDESKVQFAEYKKAFLETGGTEEELADRSMEVIVDYAIKSQNQNYVSFVVSCFQNSFSAYTEQYFYNIDLKNNKTLSLKDLLGEDYIEIANQSIKKQMAERMAIDENLVYWNGEDEIKFESIDENTNFYIAENGNPVVVFAKYEVAPGYMGIQEFEIK